MIASLGYFTTTFTANGLVTASIDDKTYLSSLPAPWSLTIENGNQTRVGASGGVTRKGNQGGDVRIGSKGVVTVGYTVVDSRPIGANDKIYFNYNEVSYVGAGVSNFTEMVESAASGRSGEIQEWVSMLGTGERNYNQTITKAKYVVSYGSSWATAPGGKSHDFTMTSKMHFSGRAKNNDPTGGTYTVVSAQGDCGDRIVPTDVNIFSSGSVSLTIPSFLDHIDFQICQGTTVLLDAGQTNLVAGQVTLPFEQLATGLYQVYLKPFRGLRRKVSFYYTAGQNPDFKPIAMYFGDIDGNNTITQEEVSFVQSMLGKTSADPDWLYSIGNAHGWTCEMADINDDGKVDSTDFNLVANNAGRVGE